MNLDQDKIARLTPWLLENIRSEDLDSKDMADYVLSLLTSSGPPEQLFERCTSELEEFLGPQTRPFVEALFAQIAALDAPQQFPTAPAPQIGDQPFTQTPPAQATDQPILSGGQEELRRNFRNEQPPHRDFGPQQFNNQFQPRFGGNQFGGNQFGSNQFQPFPPFAPGGGMPQPPNNGLPPQFGFQGFGKPINRHQNHQNHNRGRSNLSSIHNEMSVANRRLIVEKIPDEFLNEEAIRNYFGKFGNVTQVKIVPPQNLADIEFEGHDQAVAAHKSPEPIFGNRFVKVFWRKKQDEEPEPELDIEAVRRMQAIKQEQFEGREQKRKELTVQLRTAMNEQVAVLQRRQELLKSGQSTPELQQQLQDQSNSLSEQTKQLKQALSVLTGTASAPPTRGGFRGRGGAFRGGRGAFRGGANPMGLRPPTSFRSNVANASIDRRPKNVMLSGIPEQNDEALKSELAVRNYTNFARNDADTVTVSFPDRQTAEEFYKAELPEFQEVKKKWVNDAEIMAE